MPTLLARGCSPELAARVKAYAHTHNLGVSDAVAQLLEVGLVSAARLITASAARWDGSTPQERSEAASHASRARWKLDRDAYGR